MFWSEVVIVENAYLEHGRVGAITKISQRKYAQNLQQKMESSHEQIYVIITHGLKIRYSAFMSTFRPDNRLVAKTGI